LWLATKEFDSADFEFRSFPEGIENRPSPSMAESQSLSVKLQETISHVDQILRSVCESSATPSETVDALSQLATLEDLHTFMEYHVFAVWDFMSLLKTLQRRLTCVDVPWSPAPSRRACRLINEIVLAEESDDDGEGSFASHFELYLAAMEDAGASTDTVTSFLRHLRVTGNWQTPAEQTPLPIEVRRFFLSTFRVIESAELPAIAAAFTFGREDLLPDVFERIVASLNQRSDGRLDGFEYYLRRHIELDGDQHGEMARMLIEELCGDSDERWESARIAASDALFARLDLWDAIARQLATVRVFTPLAH
jgi:hypothetical protein